MRRISTCGEFRIVSSARGSRSERLVSGVLEEPGNGRAVVLETDPETYAEAVLEAEAGDLAGEAGRALRAVVVWNGARGSAPGGGRHRETGSLCDSTHCMVFMGSLPGRAPKRDGCTDPELLRLLEGIASREALDWLSFSKGGDDRWVRRIPAGEMARLVDESVVLDLRRERARNGDVSIHLFYGEHEEVVPCEIFRSRLKLPSCPEAIRPDDAGSRGGGEWILEGIGQGHGRGLSVERARALAESGWDATAILKDAYLKN